jgi:serine/threonine protein kinase
MNHSSITTDDGLRARLHAVLDDCLSRRAAGEIISDEEICARHADLMPHLAEELKLLALVEKARTSTAGGSSSKRASAAGSAPPVDAVAGYELLNEIHRGGQGVVYRARQKSTGRTVAIKIMREGPFGGSRDRSRFEREVYVLSQLNHPNIVGIIDSGIAAGSAYFVMDHVVGEPLDRVFDADERVPLTRAEIARRVTLFIKICAAVHAAHLRGIIHRDLKPNNILVDAAGEPQILDFGLAKIDSIVGEDASIQVTFTTAGHFVGTLPWASPEQAGGEVSAIDVRTDVYSLGVLLYQMLTGRFPYTVTGSLSRVLDAIQATPPTRPSAVRRGIDDDLETIVLKCLAKERERRYQSAGDVAADLQSYLQNRPIAARRDSTWYVLRKSFRRHRLAVGVVAAFAVLLVGSSILAWVLSLRANYAAREARRAQAVAARAEHEAVSNLRQALLDQVRVIRRSTKVGQRYDSLNAISRAAAISPGVDLRNEAIAALVLPDIRKVRKVAEGGIGLVDGPCERCAVQHFDGSDTIVRISDGAELAQIPAPEGGCGTVYRTSLVGDRLVRCFDPPTGARRLEVWSVVEPRLLLRLEDVPYRARHDVSPDGRQFVIGRTDNALHFYDLATCSEVRQILLDRVPAYVSYCPSGGALVLYHAAFSAAEILDLATEERQPIFDSRMITWSVAWHPDGRLVAGVTGADFEVWDAVQRRRVAVLASHQEQITDLSFSHDGKHLVSASWDGHAVIWDMETLQPILRLDANNVAFHPDNHHIITTGVQDQKLQTAIYEFAHADYCQRIPPSEARDSAGVAEAGFCRATGHLIVINGRVDARSTLRVLHPTSGRVLAEQRIAAAWTLAVDPASRFLLTAQEDGLYRWPIRQAAGRLSIGPPELAVAGKGWTSISLPSTGAFAVMGGIEIETFTLAPLEPGAPAAHT